MIRILYLFSVLMWFFFSCKNGNKLDTPAIHKDRKLAIQTHKKVASKNQVVSKVQIIPEVILPDPYSPYPDPYPPYPYPCPIDPPGYISEPVVTCVGPPEPLPKTIRDSIVDFPPIQASFGITIQELLQFVEQKITVGEQWNYLKELGIEGKIYIRLLIDVKGKVREVTFLKFSEKQLEILKPRLITALLTMPNWTPAKDQNANAVVSEFTFPIRVGFQ